MAFIFCFFLFCGAFSSTILAASPGAVKPETLFKNSPRVSLLPEPRWEKIREGIRQQDNFVRGEIDSADVQKKLIALFDRSLETLKMTSNLSSWFEQDGSIWWSYFERVSFDEGTAKGLRLSVHQRTRLLLALKQRVLQSNPKDASALQTLLSWLSGVNLVIPFDRVIVAEAKTLLPNRYAPLLQKAISDLQKKPTQSLKTVIKNITPSQRGEFEKLSMVWTEEDGKQLHFLSENLQGLQLWLAKRLFEQARNGKVGSLSELVQARVIESVPRHLGTEEPWQLTQIDNWAAKSP